MNKLMWASIALLLVAAVCRAQNLPQADFVFDYSHLEVLKGYTISMNGGSGSAAYNIKDWFGIAADFGGYHGYPSESLTGATFTAGPRFTYRRFRSVQPYAQGLFGGSHFSANSGGITGGGAEFAMAGGAGVDIAPLHSKKLAFRLQRDYFGVRSDGSTTVCDRLSAGIVYRVGEK